VLGQVVLDQVALGGVGGAVDDVPPGHLALPQVHQGLLHLVLDLLDPHLRAPGQPGSHDGGDPLDAGLGFGGQGGGFWQVQLGSEARVIAERIRSGSHGTTRPSRFITFGASNTVDTGDAPPWARSI